LTYKMQALQISRHVVEICNDLMRNADYGKRTDKEWITNALSEAYLGLDDADNRDKIEEERKKERTVFSEDSFMKHSGELKAIKEKVADILK